VAAAGVVLQVVMNDGQVPAALRGGREVTVRRREHHLGKVWVLVDAADALDVLLRGAAAVVSDAVEAHDLVDGVAQLAGAARDVLVELLAPRAVLERDAVGKHPRAVGRLPPEQPARQPELVGRGPHEDVVVEASLLQKLRQHRGVAERVHVVADLGRDAELLEEVALPVERLPHERFTAGDVAVGLQPPPADDLPASIGHALPDALEHLGVVPLGPGVEHRRARDEREVVRLVEAVERAPEAGDDLVEALGPAPQPHRVYVSVADHVHATAGGACRRILRAHTATGPAGLSGAVNEDVTSLASPSATESLIAHRTSTTGAACRPVTRLGRPSRNALASSRTPSPQRICAAEWSPRGSYASPNLATPTVAFGSCQLDRCREPKSPCSSTPLWLERWST